MTAQEAEKLTGLKARVVEARAETGPFAAELVKIGNSIRFQLGRTVPHTARFAVQEADGSTSRHTINTTVFELVAFGPSFEAAVDMWNRNRLPSPLRNDEKAKKALEAIAA